VRKRFNPIIISLTLLVSLFFLTPNVYAVPMSPTPYSCPSIVDWGSGSGDADPPSIAAIICPLLRVVNIALYSSSLVFAIMAAYGGIKMSQSLGDPKGFQGAKDTIFYAFLGFLAVLGSFSIVGIAAGMVGINASSPQGIVNTFYASLVNLLSNFGITL